MNEHWWLTIDGAEITDGLVVWDYNLRRAVVDVAGTSWADPTSEYHEYWDGWFDMRTVNGGRSSTMNGQRMWVRHPTTGEEA